MLLLLVLCLMAGFLLVGRRGYGPVSDGAYDLAGAIYSTCNRQDAARLPQLVELVGAAKSGSTIAVGEAEVLQEIIAMAEAGDWSTATVEARRLMQDQVRFP
jgi:hypothetical protein